MKIQIENYSFDASAKTITFSDYTSIELESIISVINVTRDRVLYNPLSKDKGGTIETNVLTLETDTTIMGDNDDLYIVYDDTNVSATETKQDDIISAINTYYFNQVALGNIPGHSIVFISGENNAVSTTKETIWNTGGIYTPPTSAATLSLVSTSANDTDEGTGARTVIVNGIDTNGDLQSEVVTLNGITPVSTSLSYIDQTFSTILSVGSLNTNDGDITISHTGTVTATIIAGEGIVRRMVYIVPNNKTTSVINAGFSSGKDDELQIFGEFVQTSTSYASNVFYTDYIYQNFIPGNIEASLTFNENTFLVFNAVKTGAAGNARISSKATLLQIDN